MSIDICPTNCFHNIAELINVNYTNLLYIDKNSSQRDINYKKNDPLFNNVFVNNLEYTYKYYHIYDVFHYNYTLKCFDDNILYYIKIDIHNINTKGFTNINKSIKKAYYKILNNSKKECINNIYHILLYILWHDNDSKKLDIWKYIEEEYKKNNKNPTELMDLIFIKNNLSSNNSFSYDNNKKLILNFHKDNEHFLFDDDNCIIKYDDKPIHYSYDWEQQIYYYNLNTTTLLMIIYVKSNDDNMCLLFDDNQCYFNGINYASDLKYNDNDDDDYYLNIITSMYCFNIDDYIIFQYKKKNENKKLNECNKIACRFAILFKIHNKENKTFIYNNCSQIFISSNAYHYVYINDNM